MATTTTTEFVPLRIGIDFGGV
ncbi:unnamed protein product, partial [Adineta steineri]